MKYFNNKTHKNLVSFNDSTSIYINDDNHRNGS